MQVSSNSNSRPPITLQSVTVWLPQTMAWLYQQITYLPGWESIIVCHRIENFDQFPWPHLYCLESEGRLAVYYHKACRALGLRREPLLYERVTRLKKPDLIHSHFGPQGWKDMILAKKMGIPHIVSFYGFDVSMLPRRKPIWRRRYTELFDHIDAVLCEGPYMASRIEDLGCPGEKIHIHHLGVDLDLLPFEAREWHLGEPLRILCAAAFREKKGLEYAVEAVGRFWSAHPDVDVRLTIIGDAIQEASSEAVKRRLLRLIEEWKLKDRTSLLGFQPFEEMVAQAYRHHIFLSPSVTASDGDTEGGAPVSIIQMAASGMPIISTMHCDIPNVLAEPNRALLVPERDARALAHALEQLAISRNSWFQLVKSNRELIERDFCVKKQGKQLAEIYASVMGVKASANCCS